MFMFDWREKKRFSASPSPDGKDGNFIIIKQYVFGPVKTETHWCVWYLKLNLMISYGMPLPKLNW